MKRSREPSRSVESSTQKRFSCEGGTIADHRQRENADSLLIGAIALLDSVTVAPNLKKRRPSTSIKSLAVPVRVRYFTATLHTTFTEAGHADFGGLGQS